MTSSVDPDSCISSSIKDFVFDLHDSVRNAQIPSEQLTLYNGTFRELAAKYFTQSPWPSPQSVADECGSDALFLALYKELTQRNQSGGTARGRIDGWHVYRTLFDLLLEESDKIVGDGGEDGDKNEGKDDGKAKQEGDPIYILPEWCFDILHEFVYQFQGFCQFRSNVAATASNSISPSTGESTSNNNADTQKSTGNSLRADTVETIEVLSSNRDAWAVETVLFYLHRLVDVGTSIGSSKSKGCVTFRNLGLFASVTLSRLECLLGDYMASLKALKPIHNHSTNNNNDDNSPSSLSSISPVDNENPTANDSDSHFVTRTPEKIVSAVFPARLSMAYHAGVSYLMLRRYRDAASELGNVCAHMQRMFKTGGLRGLPGSDQFPKLLDRMIALLAILTHLCTSPVSVEDSVARMVRERHGTQLSRIEAGEEGYEDLFIFACPKFISPAVPSYQPSSLTTSSTQSSSSAASGQDAYRLQVKHFMNEVVSQRSMRKLRSYMKLYSSIGLDKLQRLVLEDEFVPLLLSYKRKTRQLERTEFPGVSTGAVSSMVKGGESGGGGEVKTGDVVVDGGDGCSAQIGSALDIHYFVENDVVHIDEVERSHRFEAYFMSQISQGKELLRDAEAMSVNISVE